MEDVEKTTMSLQEVYEFVKTATRRETTDPETGYAVISYINEAGKILIYDTVTPQPQT